MGNQSIGLLQVGSDRVDAVAIVVQKEVLLIPSDLENVLVQILDQLEVEEAEKERGEEIPDPVPGGAGLCHGDDRRLPQIEPGDDILKTCETNEKDA